MPVLQQVIQPQKAEQRGNQPNAVQQGFRHEIMNIARLIAQMEQRNQQRNENAGQPNGMA